MKEKIKVFVLKHQKVLIACWLFGLGVFVTLLVINLSKPGQIKEPTEITLSIPEVNKRIKDFTAQRDALLNQAKDVNRFLNQTPAQEKIWLDSLKIQQKQWLTNAENQINQVTVVINTLNAIKADSTVRAK